MKQWWTLADLAARKLPGLPRTKQGLASTADARRWRSASQPSGEPAARKREGRGGGWEYHVSLLPAETRIALDQAHAPSPTIGAPLTETIAVPAAACAHTARVRDARLAILAAIDRLRDGGKVSQCDADRSFVALYTQGEAGLDEWVHVTVRSISVASLYRWRQAARADDGQRLSRGHGGARRAKTIELANGGAVAVRVQRLIAEQPFFTAKDLRKGVRATFGDMLDVDGETVPLPSVSAFARYAADWKDANKAILTKLTDPDGYRSRYHVTGGSRHGHVIRLNQLWQIDASPADVMCLDGRHSIYFCIDIWSRRIVTYVSRTPRAASVLLLLRKAILAWGIPEEIETDNGTDFRAQDTQRFLAATGVAVKYCNAYSPTEKGHVERVIGTIQRSFGVWQPGFIGHSVADRKRIEGRKSFAQRRGESADELLNVQLSAADLQARLDAHITHGYEHDVHSALAMSPYARAAGWTGKLRRVADERALDVLLQPVADGGGLRTVSKEGIRIDGAVFVCLGTMPGEKVLVRMDPADLGRAQCFTPDGAQYLGEAVCAERAGLDRAEVTAKWRAAVSAMVAERTDAIRRDKRSIKLSDIAAAHARGQAAAAGKLIEFPRATDTHETPAIAAAAESLRKGPAPVAPLDEETAAVQAAAVAEFEARLAGQALVGGKPEPKPRPSAEIIVLETEDTKFLRALDLQARAASGAIAEGERTWLDRYQQSAEYQTQKSMLDQFGDAFLDAVRERARRTA